MIYKINLIRFLLAILFINVLGFTLKYLELNTFIIVFGFRFHIASFLPLTFVLTKNNLTVIKEILSSFSFKRLIKVFFILLLTTVIFIAAFYLTGLIEVGDPEYFYEFGLSSIIDYPIYLIWNLPQFILFYLFLYFLKNSVGKNFFVLLISIVLIFLYEFILIGKSNYDDLSIVSFLLVCILAAVEVKYFNDVYVFGMIMFSILWFGVLMFGSSSCNLINIFLAARYNSWDGFFTTSKNISTYILSFYFLLIIAILAVTILLEKRKNSLQRK